MKNSAHVPKIKGFPRHLLDKLHCPYCGSPFKIVVEVDASPEAVMDGIIGCDCYAYPIVSGIAVIRQISTVTSTRNEAAECLKVGDSNLALLWLLEKGCAKGVPSISELHMPIPLLSHVVARACRLIRKQVPGLPDLHIPLDRGFQEALRFSRPRHYADYLYYRFANPSLLGAIPPLIVLGGVCREKSHGLIVDLLCGIGYSSAILSSYFPELEVVATDVDFINLFLLKQFVAPEVAAICLDAELPLPFTDSLFDGCFCLDGLHYVRSKMALLREVNRIMRDDGLWIFAHMHNASGTNENAGIPLTAEGYVRRFMFGKQRLMAEREIIDQFQTDGSLDMTTQSDLAALTSENALTVAGARTDRMWKEYKSLDQTLAYRPDLLRINPLFAMEKTTEGLNLKAVWPSEGLRRECTYSASTVPETASISTQALGEISAARTRGVMPDVVRKLVRRFVLVSLPECFQAESIVSLSGHLG